MNHLLTPPKENKASSLSLSLFHSPSLNHCRKSCPHIFSNFKSPSLCGFPDSCSIYTAELHAIHLALRLICQSKKKSFLVLSNSLSVLKSISNAKCDHSLLVDLFNFYFKLCDNKDIVFAWVPGHVGIRGNNVDDLASKHALEKSINSRMAVPYSDFKVPTNVYM